MDVSLQRFSFGRWLTIATLGALAAGVIAGSLTPEVPGGILGVLVGVVETVGAAWVRALRMIVLPLVVSLLVLAVLGSREHAEVARMGGAAVGIFFAIYLALAVLTALLYPPLIRAAGIARGAMSSPETESAAAVEVPTGLEFADWLLEIVPSNPFAAGAEGNILQVVVFTILFAVAVGRLAPAVRETVAAFFTPIGEAMLVIVAWLLKVSPLAVFALAFAAAREIGFDAAWVLLSFALITSAIMILATIGLAPVAGLLGRVGTLRFMRAAWPGQMVGFTTRSSLASLPALVDGAKARLGLPDHVVGFGLPFAASTFKPNRLVSSPGRLLFLSWVYGIPVDPMGYAMFIGYVMLLSATTIGIPNQGSRMTTLPAYLALGMPIEGVVLLHSVDMIWDFSATVLNSTGYLAATTILPRSAAAPEPASVAIHDGAGGPG